MFEAMLALVMGETLGGAGFEPPVDGLGYNRILKADRRAVRDPLTDTSVLICDDKQMAGSAG